MPSFKLVTAFTSLVLALTTVVSAAPIIERRQTPTQSQSPGGSACNITSPNDPLFYLHHAFIDKIWLEWQTRHPDQIHDTTSALSGSKITQLRGLIDQITKSEDCKDVVIRHVVDAVAKKAHVRRIHQAHLEDALVNGRDIGLNDS